LLKGFMRDIALAMQARSGVTPALFVWVGVALCASLTAFAFLCVAGYDWLSPQFGALYAALIMAGGFVVVALIGVIAAGVSRRRAQARAIAERAARAQAASSMLLDPKVLGVVMRAGRTLGWQRVAPVALLCFVAAQWLLNRRARRSEDDAEAQ
jgi:heme exporter protein D